MNEGAGSVSIRVFVQNGILDRDVKVTLSTVNGSALSESLKQLYFNTSITINIFHVFIVSFLQLGWTMQL